MIKGKPDQGKFFDFNPDMIYVTEIGELVSRVGMEIADRYMWAVYLVYHPESSLFLTALSHRLEWVQKNYLKEHDFKWSCVDDVIMVFPSVAMTKEEQMYHDAVLLYDEANRDARGLMPKDKAAFINSMPKAAATIEQMEKKYNESKNSVTPSRSAGEAQSGFLSRHKK
jgi:hypothetical protein